MRWAFFLAEAKRGQQHGGKDGDEGDDDQQRYEGEGVFAGFHAGIFAPSQIYIKHLVAGELDGFCPGGDSFVQVRFCVLPLPFCQKLVRYVRPFHRTIA